MDATRFDYDANPERYRLGMRMADRYTTGESLYAWIARRLEGEPDGVVLDVGSAEGALGVAVGPRRTVIGLDRSPTMLARQQGPVVLGDAIALPFARATFGVVVAINVFDHLADPLTGIREAHRVLRGGGLFVAAASSRRDAPELAAYWRPRPTTFDAEDAGDLVREVFGTGEVEAWDAPLYTLPTAGSVRDFLLVRHAPLAVAEAAATGLPTPLVVTKRGAAVFARAPRAWP